MCSTHQREQAMSETKTKAKAESGKESDEGSARRVYPLAILEMRDPPKQMGLRAYTIRSGNGVKLAADYDLRVVLVKKGKKTPYEVPFEACRGWQRQS